MGEGILGKLVLGNDLWLEPRKLIGQRSLVNPRGDFFISSFFNH